MKIWMLSDDATSMQFSYKNPEIDSVKNINYFDGRKMQPAWKPIELITVKKERGQDFSLYLGGAPIFSKKSKVILDPLIHNYIEYLPIIHEELDIYLVNILNVIDCVDEERSIARRYKNGSLAGKFIKYTKIFFKEELLLEDPIIFKIPQMSTRIYVSDTFRNQVLQAKLKGFVFTEIWDSETTEEMEQERQDRYNAKLAEVENSKSPRLSYSDAIKVVESGRAVAHKQWKMQLNKNGVMLHGILKEDCSYQWIDPVYIPPIFLEIEWVEVEKSDI